MAVWNTYLVEHYRPGLTVDALQQTALQIHAACSSMEREGHSVRHVRSTIVPNDEAFLTLVEATSETLVREAYGRSGVSFDRISRAVTTDG